MAKTETILFLPFSPYIPDVLFGTGNNVWNTQFQGAHTVRWRSSVSKGSGVMKGGVQEKSFSGCVCERNDLMMLMIARNAALIKRIPESQRRLMMIIE